MGNWDNLYYEINEELTLSGSKNRFNSLVLELSKSDEYKYHPIRERWKVALKMIRNNEQ